MPDGLPPSFESFERLQIDTSSAYLTLQLIRTDAILDQLNHNSSPTVYWRVEGSLLDLTVVRPVAFFTWNAQTFTGRLRRRGLIFLMAVLRPILYATNRKFATRMVHTVLRGVSKDRLDLLGEEYFQYKLKPHLKDHGAEQVRELVRAGRRCCPGQPGTRPHHASACASTLA